MCLSAQPPPRSGNVTGEHPRQPAGRRALPVPVGLEPTGQGREPLDDERRPTGGAAHRRASPGFWAVQVVLLTSWGRRVVADRFWGCPEHGHGRLPEAPSPGPVDLKSFLYRRA